MIWRVEYTTILFQTDFSTLSPYMLVQNWSVFLSHIEFLQLNGRRAIYIRTVLSPHIYLNTVNVYNQVWWLHNSLDIYRGERKIFSDGTGPQDAAKDMNNVLKTV